MPSPQPWKKKACAGISAAGPRAVEQHASALRVVLDNGEAVEGELILSAIGLKPRTALAQAAGLTIQSRHHGRPDARHQ